VRADHARPAGANAAPKSKSRSDPHGDLESNNMSEESILPSPIHSKNYFSDGAGIVKTTAIVIENSAASLDSGHAHSESQPWSGASEAEITPERKIDDRV
jgi:hypothetical protein